MNLIAVRYPAFRKLSDTIKLMFARPVRTQLAALCYRDGIDEPEILLITSRKTKRLIIPKGWPMAKHSARKTAKIEAYEEAGIIGKVAKEPIGEFRSLKGLGNGFSVKTNIVVYPLKVEEQLTEYPETGQRDLLWLPVNEAAEKCQDEGLRALLRSDPVKSLLMDNK
ncbi:MAG: NUDIX hydrolase [Salaquimonas sp.]